MVLPFLTGQIPQIGSALSPMHIPVLLCGFLCGGGVGLCVGFIAPLLRSLLFGIPVFFPQAVSMAFELATYGLLSGLLYRALPRKTSSIYVALIVSMFVGRLVWGAARFVLAGLSGSSFPFSAFLAGAFTNAVPGIVLHIVLIPLIVMALEKAGLIDR
jgi:LytS/YehU family sensor histidine kinase